MKTGFPGNQKSDRGSVDYRRLQGFPDTFQCHPKAAIAKKQFGNAVSIPVVEAIASQLLAYLVVAISH